MSSRGPSDDRGGTVRWSTTTSRNAFRTPHEMQHEHFHNVLSTLHVHLDHDHCLEVLVLKGKIIGGAEMGRTDFDQGRAARALTITTSGAL